MSPNIYIQLATHQDLSAIERVGDALFDHPMKPERTKEFLNDQRHHLVLAYHETEIVGMASAFHYVHPDKDPMLFVNEVGVLDAFRNQGIARALVKQLLAHAKSIGCTGAWVATETSNFTARKAFVATGGREQEQPIVLIEYDLP